MKTKNVLITGATGMVGSVVLRLCLDNPEVSSVTAIGRRGTGVRHSKLREVLHNDFLDYGSIKSVFENQQLALYCIGVYTGAVPDEKFQEITVDYTKAFSRTLYDQSPGAALCFLSGAGADQTEKSRMSFARYKGIAENHVLQTGFPRVHTFRPGYIYPVTPRKEPNVMYRVMRVLWPILKRIIPGMGISSTDLAAAMVKVGLEGADLTILENRDIQRLITK